MPTLLCVSFDHRLSFDSKFNRQYILTKETSSRRIGILAENKKAHTMVGLTIQMIRLMQIIFLFYRTLPASYA